MSRFTVYTPENYALQAKLETCHVFAAVNEGFTIAQRLADLPCRQKVPGSNPGGAASNLACKV